MPNVALVTALLCVVLCLLHYTSAQAKPVNMSDSRLHLFSEYKQAAIAPGALLKQVIDPNSYVTFESLCSSNSKLDFYFFRSVAEYELWRTGHYLPGSAYEAASKAQYEYFSFKDFVSSTTNQSVIVISNPTSALFASQLIYNFSVRPVSQAAKILLGFIIGFGVLGLVLLVCCILCVALVLFIVCCCHVKKRETLPYQEVEKVF